MLPLVNVPIINYTIEFLAASGISDIFVFCNSHAEAIIQHIEYARLARSLALAR